MTTTSEMRLPYSSSKPIPISIIHSNNNNNSHHHHHIHSHNNIIQKPTTSINTFSNTTTISISPLPNSNIINVENDNNNALNSSIDSCISSSKSKKRSSSSKKSSSSSSSSKKNVQKVQCIMCQSSIYNPFIVVETPKHNLYFCSMMCFSKKSP